MIKQLKKYIFILVISILSFETIYAQTIEDKTIENSDNILKLSLKTNVSLAAQTGISKKFYLYSAGIQFPKLLTLSKHEKEIIRFNVDFAGIIVRKHKRTNNFDPNFNTKISIQKILYSETNFNLNIASITLLNFGKNKIVEHEIVVDKLNHLEVSNLSGIVFSKTNNKSKFTLAAGVKTSNMQNIDFGYIASVLKSILNKKIIGFIKIENTSSINHQVAVGAIYLI